MASRLTPFSLNYGLRTTDYGLNDWRILIDQPRTGAEHMAFDERLAGEGIPTVRFFTWEPAAVSLGWKQPEPEWLGALPRRSSELEVVERPTGGGIAFHGSDLSLAVVAPRALGLSLHTLMSVICESTARLCGLFGIDATCRLEAINAERITYCLTQESPFSICVDGYKVAGFALRRYPESWLIQGSLLIRPLLHALAHAMPPDVMARLSARAIPLSEATILWSPTPLGRGGTLKPRPTWGDIPPTLPSGTTNGAPLTSSMSRGPMAGSHGAS